MGERDRASAVGGPCSATEGQVRFVTGFALALFFRRHFIVSPYAANKYAVCNWLCLVMARFRAIRSMAVAVQITARGTGAAFIYTPITSQALGEMPRRDRSRPGGITNYELRITKDK